MKKIILSLVSLLMAVGSPALAQEQTYVEQAEVDKAKIESVQKNLDAEGNPYGVRIESISTESVERITNPSDSAKTTRGAAVFNLDMQKYVFTYKSFDGKRDSIRISAVAYFKANFNYDKMLLSCHPTVFSNHAAPTGSAPVDEAIKRICDDNYLVVCPDYCGYGHSTFRQHPYLIHDVTARNCIDGCMAALDLAKNGLGHQPSGDNFTTWIVGYSQGGATALACHKYLESNNCPDNVKNTLRLTRTCCGDGPYSSVATVKQYLEWGREGKGLEYPCVLPLIVAAAKDAYGEGCMRTVNLEDYFTEDFLATGIIEMLNDKNATGDLNFKLLEKMKAKEGSTLPVNVFSDKIINPDGTFNTTTNEYKCLMRALETNDLASGWVPQKEIKFYHIGCDGVVPYANLEAVKNGIMKNNPNVKEVTPEDAHDCGIFGIQYYAQKNQGVRDVDFDNVDHATGGKVFYVDYLFGDQLR
ncbi:MAG: hypothetical protein HUJ97_02065 [Bacteroidales bacterium]|nr:hypothetical protein [Bacteroidales bacterium]